MFDSEARLVGLTTLYHKDGQSLNFAIPVEWLADLKPGKKTASKQRSQIDWLTRAAALEEKKDWAGLLAWGKQWNKIEPRNAVAWFVIGHAHQGLNQLDPAIAAYRQALRIDPESATAWNNLGSIYDDLKRYDDAIAAYRQALRIDPEDASAWTTWGPPTPPSSVLTTPSPLSARGCASTRKMPMPGATWLLPITCPATHMPHCKR